MLNEAIDTRDGCAPQVRSRGTCGTMTRNEQLEELILNNRPISMERAARIVGCHRKRIEKAIDEGRLPYIQRGQHRVVRPQDVCLPGLESRVCPAAEKVLNLRTRKPRPSASPMNPLAAKWLTPSRVPIPKPSDQQSSIALTQSTIGFFWGLRGIRYFSISSKRAWPMKVTKSPGGNPGRLASAVHAMCLSR